MNSFMTSGTKAFLKQLIEKYDDKNILFMQSGSTALAYYEEDKKKSIFSAGKKFEILVDSGRLAHIGIVAMHHLKILGDEAQTFENKSKAMMKKLEETPRVLAARLLRNKKTNEYIIFSQWQTEDDFERWQEEVKGTAFDFDNLAKMPAYFANRPYTLTYYLIDDED